MGVYGAAKDYHRMFAAGLALAGTWAPDEAPYMTRTPLTIYHGAADRQIPGSAAYQLSENINLVGGSSYFVSLDGAGHDIWKTVYASEQPWNWLFRQRNSFAAN
jgi:predicted peptidase